ncbi:hypothetical protein Ssi03_30740 [Sphaerisporangium siamense]|uniref:Uncharacterized protein n=1 Tax=Sphaerisporangium siamense TaxID=795645 RepID=A0A7W7DCD0_9ACTN|nr:hypothetical protein [Sphaerisporangium siamense]MBB4704234.1 hypothetical protein [Sphaerisporangium siamense]GII85084.1 hypothetical protein Ssi03_30740 [Sphaerisporangium siamense]
MAAIEDATLLGLAVRGFLAHPPLDLMAREPLPASALKERIEDSLAYLEASGILSVNDHNSLLNFVTKDVVPGERPAEHPPAVGAVLATVARRLHGDPGAAAALAHVADAAVSGAAHGGPHGALACASIAGVRVLSGTKSDDDLALLRDKALGTKSAFRL